MWVTISIKWIVLQVNLSKGTFTLHLLRSPFFLLCHAGLVVCSNRKCRLNEGRLFFTVVDLTNSSNNLREIHVSILINPSYKMWPSCCVFEQEMHIEWMPIVLFTEFRQNVVWPVTSYTRCSIINSAKHMNENFMWALFGLGKFGRFCWD